MFSYTLYSQENKADKMNSSLMPYLLSKLETACINKAGDGSSLSKALRL